MLLLACVLVFLSVMLLFAAFGTQMASAPRRAAVGRLRRREGALPTTYDETLTEPAAAAPQERRWWDSLWPGARRTRPSDLTVVGLSTDTDASRMLLHAGYRSSSTLRTYQASRMACALVLGTIPVVLIVRGAVEPREGVLLMCLLALAGFLLPRIWVRIQARGRQHRLRLSLPDALDLLVVCVEAGMGLNQAIVRVSEELRDTHPWIADEFRLVNLEIRAGRTRPDALRSLGERTGVDDIISLASMIIQTDKFGTSIARSLRVHSDSLRTERRQRAEEAAAKTTIKLIFPLLFCVFPALFITILGPAALHLWKIFGHGIR